MGGAISAIAALFQSDVPTRLFKACAENKANDVRTLLPRDADVDTFREPDTGLTLLMVCAKSNAVDAARVLFDHPRPAEVNLCHPQWRTTALMFAAGWGSALMVRLLLERGADASLVSLSGMTALDHARKENMVEAARCIEASVALFQGQMLLERSTPFQLLSGLVMGAKAKERMRDRAGGNWQTVFVTVIELGEHSEVAVFASALAAAPERAFCAKDLQLGPVKRAGDVVALEVEMRRGTKPAKDEAAVPIARLRATAGDVKKVRFGSADPVAVDRLMRALARFAPAGAAPLPAGALPSTPTSPSPRRRTAPLPPAAWACSRCTLLNEGGRSTCDACGFSSSPAEASRALPEPPSARVVAVATAPVARGLVPHDSFLCPLTADVLRDPVICLDGYSYERSAIEAYFRSGRMRSPVTGKELPATTMVSNESLKAAIRAWQASLEDVPTAVALT